MLHGMQVYLHFKVKEDLAREWTGNFWQSKKVIIFEVAFRFRSLFRGNSGRFISRID